MNKVFSITMAYCQPDMLINGLNNLSETAGRQPDYKLVLDNRWPMGAPDHADQISLIAEHFGAKSYIVEKNLGGTIGFNYLVKCADELGCDQDDFILYFDPDTNVVNHGWLTAMMEVMKADPKISVLCLWPFQNMRTDFVETEVAGHKLRVYGAADMYSCCIWRRSFIGKGIEGWFKYYGQIEIPAFEKAHRLGMYPAYLRDFKEAPCPISHPKEYTRWKMEHVSNSFTGDFAEYLRTK